MGWSCEPANKSKRNANATASLIQNFDIAEQALKSATDSAGSAASENEKYLDSILGKVAQFNAAFETLSATVIDADFSKGVVDAGTTILDTINGLIDGLGTLNTLAMGVGAALSLGKVNSIFSPIQFGVKATDKGGDFTKSFSIGFSSQLSRDKAGIEAYNKALVNFEEECKKIPTVLKGGKNVTDYSSAYNKLKDAADKASVAVSGAAKEMIKADLESQNGAKVVKSGAKGISDSTKSLVDFRLKTIAATAATTALNMAISLGLSLAIQGLVTGLDYLIHREERITEAAQEAEASVSGIRDELDELKSSTDSAAATVSAFGDQVKYVNGQLTSDTLSTEQIELYSEAVKTLTEQYPTLISGYDAEGNAIINLSGGYEKLAERIEEAYKAKMMLLNAELDEDMPDIVKGATEEVKSLLRDLSNIQTTIDDAKQALSGEEVSRGFNVASRDLVEWLYGEGAKEVSFSFDVPDEIRQLITQEGGEWFENNGYLRVSFSKDSASRGTYGGHQKFNLEKGGKLVDEEAVSNYLLYIMGNPGVGTSAYIQEMESEADRIKAQIQAKWAETNQSLLTYFSTDDSFSQINSEFGGLLSNIISGADWNTLLDGDVTWDNIKDYVQTNLVEVFNKIDLGGARANMKSLLAGGADLTVDSFKQVLNSVRSALLEATNGNEKQVEAIMSALEGSMAVTAEDIEDISKRVFEGVDDQSSALEILKDRGEQWVEAGVTGAEVLDEFYDSIENGNPTIAELQALIEMTSNGSLIAADSFEEWRKQYADCVKAFSNVKPYNDIVESFGSLKEVADSAYKTFNSLTGNVSKAEYDSWDFDEYRNKSVEIFNKFKSLYEEGRVGSREFAQYLKYFGLKDAEAAGEFIRTQADYYIEGKEGLENWLSRIYDMNRSGELSPDLISVDFLDNGKAKIDFDVKRVKEIAAVLRTTEEQVWNFIRATRAYSENWESMSAEDLFEDLDAHGLIEKTGDEFMVMYDDIANYTGLSRTEIEELIKKLNELEQFNGKLRLELGLLGDLEAAGDNLEKISQILLKYDIPAYFDIDEGTLKVTQSMIDGMLERLSPEKVKEIITQWSQITGIEIPVGLKVNDESVDDLIKNATDDGNNETETETHTTNYIDNKVTGKEDVDNLYKTLQKVRNMPNIHKTVSVNVVQPSTSGSSPSKILDQGFGPRAFGASAKGTQGASPGLSLLGDEVSPTGAPRPELVVSDGEAYLAGVDGPTIGYLKRGDQVYTYSQTKKILSGNKNLKRIPAFAGGIGNFSYRGSFGAGSLWSSVASSSGSYAAGSDFESLYKYHQHLLKMEQESQKDYLDWLNKAYKDAYARGEIELDDYYKYQEEIFDLIRELVQDNLNDAEHYIDMLGHYDGNEKQIIAIYKDLMSAIEKEIASARAAGLTDNDEYLQNLQTQWWSYYDEIIDIQDEIADNAKNAVKDLVDLRVKMIKQDLKNEKDALKEKKSALKDFYDAQKEMLQDQYDEEEYLDEQAEKRKAVTDLEMQLSRLSNDDSAWAQKKRLQLESDLSDARKELQDFEKQHALETAQDQIDKAYEIEEKGIDDSIDLIEDKEDNAKALREQALADLRSADEQMYNDMIEWNAKYGSGIDQDITDAWTEATKAMSEYFKLNQKYYEDINITQGVYPEFAPKNNGSWSTNPISGDNPNNKSQTPSQGSANSGKAGSVSNIGPQLKYGSRGSDVSALQTALKEMGLYSDKIDGHFGPNTRAGVMAFQRQEGISVDGIVGPNTKAKFRNHGYASGTSNALAGLHEIWEEGSEYIFTSSNGKKYRMFSGGEKVLNADATNFLYDFANSGGKVLETIVNKLMNGNGLPNVNPSVYSSVVNMGDLIIQGSASDRTVSEIRRAQREQVDFMLKEFKKLRP